MKEPICISRVEKKFAEKQALYPFSLTIEPGTCVALCGGNGAGKSTLLRILAGIYQPDGGTITGLNRYSYGFMPDSIQIPSGVSGREWLAFLARLKGVSLKQIDSVLEMTGLTKVAGRDAVSYSRGMMQRLLFAQMILGDPDLLLMDEPGNGLDPFWLDEWKRWILGFKQKGKTILFSSHMLRDVVAVSDRIVVIHEGKMIADDPVDLWLKDGLEPEQKFLQMVIKNR